MTPGAQRDAILARRALLRRQTTLLGPRLPWLADPARIPASAVDASVPAGDVRLAAFSLAAWMLIEVLEAADGVQAALAWDETLERFAVHPALRPSVQRSVLCPAAKHAPGLFAIAEIVAVVPPLAARGGLPRAEWPAVASRAQAFGARLARDGTAVQVLLRDYLSRPPAGAAAAPVRSLQPAWLRLDAATGVGTVTPLETLLAAARRAALRHYGSAEGICVALQAPAPPAAGAASMFEALWAAFAAAAGRLVFPRFDAREPVAAAAPPDAHPDAVFEQLAACRGAQLRALAAQPTPPAAARILENLLSQRRARA